MANGGKLRLAALLGLSAVWLLVLCAPALAHARLVETYPADGDILANSPEQVQLRFNEPVEAEFEPIQVYDQGGERLEEGTARVSPDDQRLLLMDLESSEDSHTVEWRVTSADGHPVSGEYEFAVDASAADAGAGNPLQSVERSTEQEEEGSSWVPVVVLGVLLAGAALAGLVLLVIFRGKGTV